MFTALDENNNNVYAWNCEKGKEYRCKYCDEIVMLKRGNVRRPHFAHLKDTECKYDFENGMSEWHIRMQNFFPPENREYIFKDPVTGEKHIADVFIKEKNTVIEFQHSRISDEEFFSRTKFHLDNGRRIAWIFDESVKDQKNDDLGRFRKVEDGNNWIYKGKQYKWMRSPRTCLKVGPPVSMDSPYNKYYSVFAYTGREEEVLHRIVSQEFGFKEVTFSVHNTTISQNLDIDELFYTEFEWFNEEPWKSIFDTINKLSNKATTKKDIQTRPVIQKRRPTYYVRRKWHF